MHKKNQTKFGRRQFLGLSAAGLTALACARRTPMVSAVEPKIEKGIAWYNVEDWGVEGKGWSDTARYYDRLPARAEGVVRPPVWSLSRHSAGMLVQFETDARAIHVRYSLLSPNVAMYHMPATGVSGVDLYARDTEGRDRWLAVSRPTSQQIQAVISADIDPLPGGEPLDIEIQVIPAFGNWADVGQMVVEDWADVGVKAHVEIRERALGFQMRDTNDLMTEIWNDDTTPFPFSAQPKQDPRSTIGLTFAPLVRTWYQTNGEKGMEPPPEIKKIVDIIDEGKISAPERQAELAQELYRMWTDYLWSIGTVGMTPMIQGVVVVNDNLMNVPETAGNNWPFRTPGNTRPEQYFFTK